MISRAVVTVSYDSDGPLESFLASLSPAQHTDTAVYVADNLPDKGMAAAIAASHGAQYLRMPGNLGYGGAINRVFDTIPSTVNWVLISNPDVVLEEDAISTLIRTAEQDDRIGSVGPMVKNPDGTVYPSARRVPSIRTGIGHALFANVWQGNPWTAKYHNDDGTDPALRRAGWLSGSCLLVRREAFDSIGGFDDDFFMYFEDVDLGYRLDKAGWKNIYQPAAKVVHAGAHSTAKSPSLMLQAHHRSAERFIKKKYSHPLLWPIRLLATTGLRLRAALALRNSLRQDR
jgi:N-acetylglucosaminyl-diphospho-decaprenol L-rhamnosyltransferase